MYLGIDVGGSKTLVAIFSHNGELKHEKKIPTPEKYPDFIKSLKLVLAEPDFEQTFDGCCCAMPGKIDRSQGLVLEFGNENWHNVPIKSDLEKLLPGCRVLVENDAKLAAVYEASELKDRYRKVAYITISTGIGAGFVQDGKLDPVLADGEVGFMLLPHNGKLEKWEDFASGRALVKKYGKKAVDIDDPKIWQEYSADVALGIDAILAVVQPEVVVIGGGVGAHLEKFKPFLEAELKKFENKLVHIPPILKAKKAEEAVIYGCYEYIKQSH